MTGEADQMARAGDYVLGLMEDGERARAERDLEIDPGFRDAVVRVAARMHRLDLKPPAETAPADVWKTVAARIAELPQMGGARAPGPAVATETQMQAARAGRIVPSPLARIRGIGLHAAPGERAAAIAAGLIAACALGYIAGVVTGGLW